MKNLLFIILLSSFTACVSTGSKKQVKDDLKASFSTFYVAPYKVDCMGVAPMKCLLIKKTPEGQWQNFHSAISGFEHQPGIEYTIKVKETPVENPPADASSISYELVEIIESKAYAPKSNILHDIWGAVEVNGTNPLSKQCEQTLELNLSDNTILGEAGCNNFRGHLNVKEGSNSISFHDIVSTRRTCPNQALEDSYLSALNSVDAYFRFNQHLYLISNNQVVIKLKRMD